jgi:plastocyanin
MKTKLLPSLGFRMAALSTLMILTLAACGDDNNINRGNAPAPGAPGTTPEVMIPIVSGAMDLGTDAFGENPRHVGQGTRVTWVNNDSMAHTATSMDGIWDSDAIQPGASFSRVFDEAGTFDYFCEIHPSMQGTLIVDPATSPSPSPSPAPSPSPSPVMR